MYEHFKDAEPGFITNLILPQSAETTRSMISKTREGVFGILDGIPVLNLVPKLARAVI